jgi:hypothetical protein
MSKTRRNFEAMPIRPDDGNWVVFFHGDEHIGSVQVFPGYTKSGWADDITEDIQIECEKHAVEQYEAVMVERFRQTLLASIRKGGAA